MNIEIKEKIKVTKSSDVANIFNSILVSENEVDQDKEHFWITGLNADGTIKFIELVSLGVLNGSMVHPREVFRMAIIKGVCNIVCCHNHPSGNIQPSEEDKATTQRLIKAGEIIGIPVLDHIIVGDGSFSFAENGLI